MFYSEIFIKITDTVTYKYQGPGGGKYYKKHIETSYFEKFQDFICLFVVSLLLIISAWLYYTPPDQTY